ncbi:hypothetical protein DSECCO2_609150 [anaerobic digester metagenome]
MSYQKTMCRTFRQSARNLHLNRAIHCKSFLYRFHEKLFYESTALSCYKHIKMHHYILRQYMDRILFRPCPEKFQHEKLCCHHNSMLLLVECRYLQFFPPSPIDRFVKLIWLKRRSISRRKQILISYFYFLSKLSNVLNVQITFL